MAHASLDRYPLYIPTAKRATEPETSASKRTGLGLNYFASVYVNRSGIALTTNRPVVSGAFPAGSYEEVHKTW